MDSWSTLPGVRLTSIDAHTAGEPLRVIIDGFPEPSGDTMLAKRRHAAQHLDHFRRALMWEPRGHADMYGCVLTAPVTGDGDVGVLFLHNEGYSTMCGHGIIGLVTVGLETGVLQLPASGEIRIDTPAGRVVATPQCRAGRVMAVSFRNVPSFVLHSGFSIDVAGLGEVRGDLAFGGAFYAYVDAEPLGLSVEPQFTPQLVDAAMSIKHAVAAALPIAHPGGDPELGFLYGTILVEPAVAGRHGRNVCVFADGEVDRSPTGTGVSGRAAIHHARGELATGEAMTIDSVIGTSFLVRVVATTRVGEYAAVVPEVTGSAYITGRHEFLLDPADPLRAGFLLR